MKITAIKQQVKRQGRYSVFVDGTYGFSLSDGALLDSGLTLGKEIDEAELAALKQASADDKLYNSALGYATLRPRSRWEMEEYFRRKKASPDAIQKILNKLSNIGMLDDEGFARSWVANRRLLKKTSKRRLQQELRTKRVAEDIITRVLAEDGTDEQTVLAELIAVKRRQSRYRDDQKLMQYLAGQGFGYGDIKAALEAAGAPEDPS
jgi:regulatory protein